MKSKDQSGSEDISADERKFTMSLTWSEKSLGISFIKAKAKYQELFFPSMKLCLFCLI